MNRKKPFSYLLALLIIFTLAGVYILSTSTENVNNPALVVFRIDDIQDYAFRDAQLYLIEHARLSNIPLSLAVIPKFFGEDNELVEAVKQTVVSGSEVTAHGWKHENFSQYPIDEQKIRLLEAKQFLEGTLNSQITVLVPPMFSYNNDTLQAMEETGYTIVSGLAEFHNKGWVSEKVMSLPATIELSDYCDETWHMKTRSVILNEVENSIEMYGYAIIVTHPQEFMKSGNLDYGIAAKFELILQDLSNIFSFTTIKDITN